MTTEHRALTIARLRADHTKGYRTASDETWGHDPICSGCEHQWPCDTAQALALLDTPLVDDISTLVEGILDRIAKDTEPYLANLVEDDLRSIAVQAYTAGREPAETMRADVHHHVNPVIGWLRLVAHQVTPSFDPLAVPVGANDLPDLTGLPDTVEIKTRTLVASTRMLQAATDAADAALGEEPMRVQIERVQAEIAKSQETP